MRKGFTPGVRRPRIWTAAPAAFALFLLKIENCMSTEDASVSTAPPVEDRFPSNVEYRMRRSVLSLTAIPPPPAAAVFWRNIQLINLTGEDSAKIPPPV